MTPVARRLASHAATHDAYLVSLDAWHTPCIGRAKLANVREDDDRALHAALIDYHAPVERTHVVCDVESVTA